MRDFSRALARSTAARRRNPPYRIADVIGDQKGARLKRPKDLVHAMFCGVAPSRASGRLPAEHRHCKSRKRLFGY